MYKRMSTRKSKHCKNPTFGVGSKTNSDNPEIFVLPPNLLQKLGIDLENVKSTQQCSTIVLPATQNVEFEAHSIIEDNKPPTVIDSHRGSDGKTLESEKETSILETANLMKKSLLLSPTFISSTTNTLGEVSNVEMDYSDSVSVLSIDPQFHHEAFQYVFDSCDTISALNDHQVNETLHDVDCGAVVREICNNLKLDSNVVISIEEMSELEVIEDTSGNILTQVIDNTDAMSIDDHLDEAYLSDFSNSNPGPIENTGIIMYPEKNSSDQQRGAIVTNIQCNGKINILSEEILSLSQFKELKNMHNAKVCELIPVTVNTIIPGNRMNDFSHSNVELDDKLPEYNTNITLAGASYPYSEKMTASDLIVIYDDRGNEMPPPQTFGTMNLVDEMPVTFLSDQSDLEEKEFKALLENTHNEIYSTSAKLPEVVNEKMCNNNINSEGQNIDNVFGAGLDIAETDIEECLQESVDILEQIVNEITSDDSDNLHNIKDNERKPINKIIRNNSHPAPVSISHNERVSDLFVYQNDGKPINGSPEINNEKHHNVNSSPFNNNSNEIENVNNDTEAKSKMSNFRIHKTSEHTESKTNSKQICKEISEIIHSNYAPTVMCDRDENETHTKQDDKQEIHINVKQKQNKIFKESSESIHSNSVPTVMCDRDENETHTKQDGKQEIHRNLKQVLFPDNNKIHNGIDVDEKVKEIAKYLKQYGQVHSKTQAINSGTNCKQTKDSNKLYSKRSIQGVEKPGGNKNNKRSRGGSVVLKTYGRDYKHRQTFTSALVAGINCKKQSLCGSSDSLDQVLNCGNVSSYRAKEYFCMCEDFGRLDYYDCDSMYEHIHFWEHKKISCNNEDIIGIYNEHDDNFINENVSDVPVQEAEVDISEINEHSICWNDIEDKSVLDFSRGSLTVSRDNFTENARINTGESPTNTIEVAQDIITAFSHSKEAHENEKHMILFEQTIVNAGSSNKSPTEVDTGDGAVKPGSVCDDTLERLEVIPAHGPCNQNEPEEIVGYELKPRGKKRRKSYRRQQHVDEPQCKKSVKCGGEELVTELQRDDNAHGSIAWKFGDNIDSGNDPTHSADTTGDDVSMSTPLVGLNSIKCGVCGQEMNTDNWINHIAKEHNYLAWKHGEPLLDLANVEIVRKHLTNLAKHIGGLICSKCGLVRKYGKLYLHHIEVCHASEITYDDSKHNDTLSSSCVSDSNFTFEISAVDTSKSNDKSNVKKKLRSQSRDKNKDDDSHTEAISGFDDVTLESDANTSKAGYKSIVKSISENTSNMKGKLRNKSRVKWRDYDSNNKTISGSVDITLESSANNDTICSSVDITLESSANNETISSSVDVTVQSNANTSKAGYKSIVKSISDNKSNVKRKLRNKSHVKSRDDDSNNETSSGSADVTLKSDANTNKVGNKSFIKSKADNESNVKSKLRNKSFVKSKHDEVNERLSGSDDVTLEKNASEAGNKSFTKSEAAKKTIVKCGVCQEEVQSHDWLVHIQRAHDYLAWKQGETLDLNNEEDVKNHLSLIIKETGGLTCSKCGLYRKYVKSYLGHNRKCEVEPVIYDKKIQSNDKDTHVCGVCLKGGISIKDWKDHAMEKHYNIAWTVGETPIDVKNPYVVERLLKQYRDRFKRLTCGICSTSRASCMGFYAHVLVCGKSDEEAEVYKNLCPICNKKYVCIYEKQHMKAHREQEDAKERKLREVEQKVNVKTEIEIEILPGRRRAAEKAISVLKKYKSEHEYSHNCATCGFGTDSNAELERHKCEKMSGYVSNSDDSVKLEQSDSDEEPESDIDSDVSEVEENESVKRRHKDHVAMWAKTPRLPYSVYSTNEYLLSSGKKFCMFHFTDERLFPEWHSFECEPVPDDELPKYLPPLEQSCKVKFNSDIWTTYSRFEAKKQNGFSIFVGASVQCMSWVPARAGADANDSNYLAVVCHGSADAPRLEADETPEYEGLVQIWDFGCFCEIPKLVCGFALDYGTVWAMAWCPSGARDLPYTEQDDTRMGLVALACSNGSAYIFCIPYPSAVVKVEKLFHKLKPVAELRLSMGTQRNTYQATAISWSPQRGHTLVVVGYGDGTTAYYDLNTNSPLLKTKTNDVTILYPYHDERPHNTCVTDVDVFASMEARAGAGAVCSAAPSGAEAVLRPAARPERVRSHCAARRAIFQPLWPAPMLGGEDYVGVASNELEWWGCGRRFGTVRTCAACLRCARVAVSTPPLLRVLRPHPAYKEVNKRTIGTLRMSPIAKKRKKLANDELTTILEPVTYDDAVKKYGIELVLQNVPMATKELYPERFPLADVSALSFCSSAEQHSRLAVATHAGVVFVLTV